ICFGNGKIGLTAHARFEAIAHPLFEPRRIDNDEGEIAKASLTLAPVACHARRVIHQRELAPDEAVKQRRLADIGTANNGHLKRHFMRPFSAVADGNQPSAAPRYFSAVSLASLVRI